MEIIDKRTSTNPVPEVQYDDFTPTLSGCTPVFDTVLLRELKLKEEDSFILRPDAYSEPCTYAEVIAVGDGEQAHHFAPGNIVRLLSMEGIGITIQFDDAEPDQRYYTVNAQDIIAKWRN